MRRTSLLLAAVAAVAIGGACREGRPVALPAPPALPTATAGPPPDARAVPIDSLLRRDARVERVLYGRLLPGPGEQVVLHTSRDIGCPDRQDYLEVFAFDGALGRWDATFDGDRWPSASHPLIPDREDASDSCRGQEELRTVALADLDMDGLDDLVLGMATHDEDGEGPLLLEVLSFAPGIAEPLYEEATRRGGAVSVGPEGVVLVQPTFPSESGPLWRGDEEPNGLLRQVVRYDADLGQLVVVERENSLFCGSGVVEASTRDALFVACTPAMGEGSGPRLTGFRLTDDTRVLPPEVGGVQELQQGREVSVRAGSWQPDDEDDVNPVAVEIVVMDRRYTVR